MQLQRAGTDERDAGREQPASSYIGHDLDCDMSKPSVLTDQGGTRATLSLRRRRGLTRLLLGSLSQQCDHLASCPFGIVHPRGA